MYINKGSCNYRWQILSITVWINMGAYFCFDHPASLHNTIKNHFKGNIVNKFEIYFGGLYSAYSLANVFLPFITGRLRDTTGDRFVLIMMVLLINFG